jgi:tetratricopeptide (TPR) repeat protein
MSGTRDTARRTLLVLSLAAGWPSAGAAQPAPGCAGPSCAAPWPEVATIARLKQDFAASVTRFAAGLSDVSRDRRAVRSNIDALARTLDTWDTAIRALESDLRQAPRSGGHAALGTVYLERHRLDEAVSELSDAARDEPSRADIHMLMSVAYRHANRPSDAAVSLEKAYGLGRGDAATLYQIAWGLTKVGRGKEADAARGRFRASVGMTSTALDTPGPFLRFPGTAPILPPALYAPGFALLARGSYADAIARLRQAAASDHLSDDSVDAPDSLARGRAALQDGALPAALTLLESAVAAGPERAEAHRVLGTAYAIDGQGSRALEQFTAAIRLDPQDERAWMALADLLATAGQFPQAEQVLKGALQVLPGSSQAHFGLSRLYRVQGKYTDAARELEATARDALIGREALLEMLGETYGILSAFDRAAEADIARLDLDPNSVQAHRRLGDAYLRQDRDDEALTEFAAVLAIDPRDPAAHGSTAQIHLRKGQYAEAAEAARRAVDIDPSLKEAEYALGTALMRLGRADEGVAHLETYQRLQAEATISGRRQHELERLKRDASVAIANADYGTAAGLLRRSVEYEPAAATFLALGFALMQTGHHAEAIIELQQAVRLGDDPNAHRYLAEAYRAAGRDDDSRAEAQVYLQMVERAKTKRLQNMRGTP